MMPNNELIELRGLFNDIDSHLLMVLHERTRLARRMARVKKQLNLPAEQITVWQANLDRRFEENKRMALNKKFLKDVFELLHKESIRIQNRELKKLT